LNPDNNNRKSDEAEEDLRLSPASDDLNFPATADDEVPDGKDDLRQVLLNR
jgi:hypothetical protein